MRKLSLAVDKHDIAKLRHGRTIHEGSTFGLEYYQACPFFFTREGAALSMVGQYRGASAFLMAGGPSLKGLDLKPMENAWVMTLNNAHSTFRGQANCSVDDPCRFNYSMWLDPTITKFVPMAQFEKPLWDNRRIQINGESRQSWDKAEKKVGECPNVVGYRRNEKFHAPRWLYEDTINWGNHKDYGGGRSVMLAAMRILFLLGFRRVYLLGVDFEMTPEKKYHFSQDRTAGSIRGNMSTYTKLQTWFTELQPYFLDEGFAVKNCNPRSKLTAFPFIKYTEALAEATGLLGDFRNERTDGMYQTLKEKLAAQANSASPCLEAEGDFPGEREAPAAAKPSTPEN